MKFLKKPYLSWMAAVVVVGFGAAHARAEFVVDDWDWADSVTGYSAYIQNYGGTLMDDTTTWWLTGEPDADTDGNGYAWDAGDQDTVAGWRFNAPGEYVTLSWKTGIPDVAGSDLVICSYGNPAASATVSASVDGISFTDVGTIKGGTPGYFQQEYLDFAAQFSDDVYYVKITRATNGASTGMFFDAFGATTVPEPRTITLLAIGATALIVLRRRCLCSQDV